MVTRNIHSAKDSITSSAGGLLAVLWGLPKGLYSLQRVAVPRYSRMQELKVKAVGKVVVPDRNRQSLPHIGSVAKSRLWDYYEHQFHRTKMGIIFIIIIF